MWQDPNFLYPRVAEILIESLNQNGLTVLKLGNTYQANHALANGHVAESAIDHIYISPTLNEDVEYRKLPNNSTDHVPILCNINCIQNKKIFTRIIYKRSLKNFSSKEWNEKLLENDWSNMKSHIH